MDSIEFESWIEEHYGELLAVARNRVNGTNGEAEDVLHSAVMGMVVSPELVKRTTGRMWPWAVEVVRAHAAVSRRGSERRQALKGEAKIVALAGLLPKWKRPVPHQDEGGHQVHVKFYPSAAAIADGIKRRVFEQRRKRGSV